MRLVLLVASLLGLECWATKTPMIGILTLPCADDRAPCGNSTEIEPFSYFPASYVKWLESGGARIVPILVDASLESTLELLPQLNGVLFTGGAADFISSDVYWTQINTILAYLRKYHNLSLNNQSIPLWTTCLGFEALISATAKSGPSIMSSFDALDLALPINFTLYAPSSQIFNNDFMLRSLREWVYNIFVVSNASDNDHSSGIKPAAFNNDPYLMTNFSVIGYSKDRQNKAFVALIESKKELGLNWFAAQFHPEKIMFEFVERMPNIPHSLESQIANIYFAQFFVEMTRRSNDNAMMDSQYAQSVIYNYAPYYLDQYGDGAFEQVYLFPKAN